MKFSEEFMSELCKYIYEMTTKDVLKDEKKLNKLEKLLSIYNGIKNIEVSELQAEFMKQSNTAFKNVDLNNLDIKGMLNQLIGK